MLSKFLPELGSRRAIFALLAGYLFFRLALFSDFTATMDGRLYYDALSEAISARPFDVLNFAFFGHTSLLFGLVMAPWKILSGHSDQAFNVGLSLLTALGIYAFHRLLEIFGSKMSSRERLSWTALFAIHPTILSNTFNYNLDQGMLSFFLMFLAAHFTGRRAWAIVWATLAVHSKEPGLALCLLALGSDFLVEAVPYRSKRVAWIKRHALTAIIPTMSLVLFFFYKIVVRDSEGLWVTDYADAQPSLLMIINPFYAPPPRMVFFFQVVGLNFNWLFLALVIGACVLLRSKHPAEPTSSGVQRPVLLTATLFLSATYLQTRFLTFTNSRYVMVAVALFLLFAFVTISTAISRESRRTISALLLGTLLLCANLRTIDPVAMLFFGTFEFGKHRVLDTTALTGECCGRGRDQLVYNLEFFKIGALTKLALQDIKPRDGTAIATHPLAIFMLPPIDPTTLRFAKGTASVRQAFNTVGDLTRSAVPATVPYFSFPMFNNQADLKALGQLYAQSSTKVYSADGYEITVHTYTDPH